MKNNELLFRRGDADDFDALIQTCVTKTVHLVWAMVHFPPGNTNIIKSREAWGKSLRQVLLMRNSFVLTVIQGKLYFEDKLLTKVEDTVKNFIQAMAQRRLRKVIFWRGTDDRDLEGFAKLMGTKPTDLLEAGGPTVVARKLQMRNIQILEARYLAPEQRAKLGGGLSYWQSKLEQTGLDSGEVVALLSGRGRTPRLITAEILLLVEAMKDPQFLSQLLLRAACPLSAESIESDRFDDSASLEPPDPMDLLRTCQRAEYLLVVNAGFDARESPEIIARATQLFEPGIRAGLLATQLSMEAAGEQCVDGRLFAFSAEEYADYFVQIRERTGQWPALAMALRPKKDVAVAIGRAARARLMVSQRLTLSDEELTADTTRLTGMLSPPLTLVSVLPAGAEALPRITKNEAQSALKKRVNAFNLNLTEGYTYVLMHLYATTEDLAYAADLLDRLAIIIEARLEVKRYADVLSLLRAICDDRFTGERQRASRERVLKTLGPTHRSMMVQYVASEIEQGNPTVMDAVPLLIDLLGPEILDRMIDSIFRSESAAPDPALLHFLGRYSAQVAQVLQRYLSENDPWIRARAIEIMAMTQAPELQEMVLQGVSDSNPDVRTIALLSLARMPSEPCVRKLMEVAEARALPQPQRQAAIVALGDMRSSMAIPTLNRVLQHRPLTRQTMVFDTKCCAAMALRKIGTEQSLELLRTQLPYIEQTVIEVYLGRALRFVGQVCRVVFGPVVRLLRMIDAVGTAATFAVRRQMGRWAAVLNGRRPTPVVAPAPAPQSLQQASVDASTLNLSDTSFSSQIIMPGDSPGASSIGKSPRRERDRKQEGERDQAALAGASAREVTR